jgi:hypothetical protein
MGMRRTPRALPATGQRTAGAQCKSLGRSLRSRGSNKVRAEGPRYRSIVRRPRNPIHHKHLHGSFRVSSSNPSCSCTAEQPCQEACLVSESSASPFREYCAYGENCIRPCVETARRCCQPLKPLKPTKPRRYCWHVFLPGSLSLIEPFTLCIPLAPLRLALP